MRWFRRKPQHSPDATGGQFDVAQRLDSDVTLAGSSDRDEPQRTAQATVLSAARALESAVSTARMSGDGVVRAESSARVRVHSTRVAILADPLLLNQTTPTLHRGPGGSEERSPELERQAVLTRLAVLAGTVPNAGGAGPGGALDHDQQRGAVSYFYDQLVRNMRRRTEGASDQERADIAGENGALIITLANLVYPDEGDITDRLTSGRQYGDNAAHDRYALIRQLEEASIAHDPGRAQQALLMHQTRRIMITQAALRP